MRFDVLTLFPDLFSPFMNESILGRAIAKGLIEIRLTQIRSFARGKHQVTDDRPYGGGSGMVMKPGPIYRSLKSIERVTEQARVILLTPQGRPFDQSLAWELSRLPQIILICGRYEGVDERIRNRYVDQELSVGDYVLSGGEPAALVVIDAVARLVPGVLGDDYSAQEESFEDGLLEYPHYTRPPVFEEQEVPSILLSGDHAKIKQWRRTQALKRTLERRPDLLQKARLSAEDKKILSGLQKESSLR